MKMIGVQWIESTHTELLVFFGVHAFAMLSTITNPILYGWLNTNLKHLFRAMIPTVKSERVNEEYTHNPDLSPNDNNRMYDTRYSFFDFIEM